SVLLTDNNECNGPLMLVPGSHRQFISCVGETPRDHYKQSLKKQEYGVPDPVSLQLLVEQGGIRTMTAKAGSVVFFDCNTMHGSNSNISPWPRSNVFMVYNSMENTLQPPKYGLEPRPEHIATRKAFKAVTPLDKLKLVEEAAPVAPFNPARSALRGFCFQALRVAGCALVERCLTPFGSQTPNPLKQVSDSRRVSDTPSSISPRIPPNR